MPRARVQPKDVVALIVSALNGASCQSGTVRAVADGNEVRVYTHSDSPGTFGEQYSVYVH